MKLGVTGVYHLKWHQPAKIFKQTTVYWDICIPLVSQTSQPAFLIKIKVSGIFCWLIQLFLDLIKARIVVVVLFGYLCSIRKVCFPSLKPGFLLLIGRFGAEGVGSNGC